MRLDVDHRPVRSFAQPRTLDEAIELRAGLGEDAMLVAGATDVGVLLRRHQVHPEHLISLVGVPELARFDNDDDDIFLGATVTHRAVETSDWFPAAYLALREACETVGSVQTRNVGTLGGNVANASPAADTPPVLLALDAAVRVRGPRGARTLPLDDVFVDYRRTALDDDELIEGLLLPWPSGAVGSSFTKLGRRGAMEISLACVGACVGLDPEGRCERVGIGLGAVAPTPVRAREAEERLRGRVPTPDDVAAAARAAVAAARPIDDLRGSASYRRSVLEVLVRRTLQRALERARDDQGGTA